MPLSHIFLKLKIFWENDKKALFINNLSHLAQKRSTQSFKKEIEERALISFFWKLKNLESFKSYKSFKSLSKSMLPILAIVAVLRKGFFKIFIKMKVNVSRTLVFFF